MSVENIVNINESNLQQVLEQSMTTPVLFYFWSERSQHCLQLTPILESLAAQYNGQFILAKLDCDAEQMIAAQFGLRAIPTVYLFQNGQPVDGFQGPQPEEAIRALLDKVLPREEERGPNSGTVCGIVRFFRAVAAGGGRRPAASSAGNPIPGPELCAYALFVRRDSVTLHRVPPERRKCLAEPMP